MKSTVQVAGTGPHTGLPKRALGVVRAITFENTAYGFVQRFTLVNRLVESRGSQQTTQRISRCFLG